MKKRGIQRTQREVGSHTTLSDTTKIRISPEHRTSRMELLELKHHKPIEEIILSGSLKSVEKKYSVDFTTVSKWRKLLATEALRQIPQAFLKSTVEGIIANSQHAGISGVEAAENEGADI
jgi:hypothetical protein